MKTYIFFCLFIIALLTACTRSSPPAPGCRQHPQFADKHKGMGACLVRIQNELLVIQSKQADKLDLAQGVSKNGEKSQCAAHRHMWEQTGFNVQVAQLLGVTSKGLRIYSCRMGGGLNGKETELPKPPWAPAWIQRIKFVDPFTTRYNDWLNQDDLILIRDAYVAQGYTPVMSDKDIYQSSQ